MLITALSKYIFTSRRGTFLIEPDLPTFHLLSISLRE